MARKSQGKVNDFTQVVLNLTKEAQATKDAASTTSIPPFMRQQVNARQYAEKFKGMTPEQRKAEVASLGTDNVLNILRRAPQPTDSGIPMEAPNAQS